MVFFRLRKQQQTAQEPDDSRDDLKDNAGDAKEGGPVRTDSSQRASLEQDSPRTLTFKSRKPKSPKSSLGGTGGVAVASSGKVLSVNDLIGQTRSQQKQGLKPSGPELIAYARYLGIDPVADHDLLWLASEAIEAPLPLDWTEHFDNTDRVFYYHAPSKESSWTHPLEHTYRETYKQIASFRSDKIPMQEQAETLRKLQLEVERLDNEVHKSAAHWTEHHDEKGHKFYFNKEHALSSWTDPRPAMWQMLNLKRKMLKIFQANTAHAEAFVKASSEDDGRTVEATETSEQPSRRSKGGSSHHASPRLSSSPRRSDSAGELCGQKDRKEKKRKKKKRRDHEADLQKCYSSTVDYHPGRDSHSDLNIPSVSCETSHVSKSASQPLLQSSGEASDCSYTNVSRARVKAGLRLEPLALKPMGASLLKV